jgi:hypothetical protein
MKSCARGFILGTLLCPGTPIWEKHPNTRIFFQQSFHGRLLDSTVFMDKKDLAKMSKYILAPTTASVWECFQPPFVFCIEAMEMVTIAVPQSQRCTNTQRYTVRHWHNCAMSAQCLYHINRNIMTKEAFENAGTSMMSMGEYIFSHNQWKPKLTRPSRNSTALPTEHRLLQTWLSKARRDILSCTSVSNPLTSIVIKHLLVP